MIRRPWSGTAISGMMCDESISRGVSYIYRRLIQNPEIGYSVTMSKSTLSHRHRLERMVTIVISDKAALLYGDATQLRRKLMRVEAFFGQHPDGMMTEELKPLPLFGEVTANRTVILTGHVPMAVRVLEEHGATVTVVDEREWPDESVLGSDLIESLKGEDKSLALSIAGEPIGQIEVRSSRTCVTTIARIVKLFPRARITILVATRAFANRLRHQFQSELGLPVGMLHGASATRCRLTIATFSYVIHDDLRGTHVWIVTDVGALTATTVTDRFKLLRQYQQHPYRLIGLKKSTSRFSEAERLLITGHVGEVIHRVARCPILPTVYTAKSGSCGETQWSDLLGRKRQAIWHNDGRKHLVANIAQAFADCQVDRLEAHGIYLRTADRTWLLEGGRRVAVLVESAEQASALQPYLPDFPAIIAGRPDDELEFGSADHRIVTCTFAYQKMVLIDILIRADGGSDLPLVYNFPAPLTATRIKQLLIDIGDEFDRHARSDTKGRRDRYRQVGWDVVVYSRSSPPAAFQALVDPSPLVRSSNTAADAQPADVPPTRSGSKPDAAMRSTALSRQPTSTAPCSATDEHRPADTQQPNPAARSMTTDGLMMPSQRARTQKPISRILPPPFSYPKEDCN